jgi:hypothetical protein
VEGGWKWLRTGVLVMVDFQEERQYTSNVQTTHILMLIAYIFYTKPVEVFLDLPLVNV